MCVRQIIISFLSWLVNFWHCVLVWYAAGSDALVPATSVSSNAASQEPSDETGTSAASAMGIATIVGVLPGLGDYTDSDRSDTSSSDSEIDMDVFKRDVLAKHGQDAAATSATVKHRHHWVAISHTVLNYENCGTAVQSVDVFKVFVSYTVNCQWCCIYGAMN